jgi:hypothetical protein
VYALYVNVYALYPVGHARGYGLHLEAFSTNLMNSYIVDLYLQCNNFSSDVLHGSCQYVVICFCECHSPFLRFYTHFSGKDYYCYDIM